MAKPPRIPGPGPRSGPRPGSRSGPRSGSRFGPDSLSEPDREVWDRVARTVGPNRRGKAARARLKDAPAPTREEFAALMRVPPPTPSAPRQPGPLEATRAKRARRGRVRIDARLDLHDLTLAEAWPVLERGLIRAYNQGRGRATGDGLGCILVITGKGRRADGGSPAHLYTGKLRAALPGWLDGPSLRPIVATYSPAHPRHGGDGAWYVFLKG